MKQSLRVIALLGLLATWGLPALAAPVAMISDLRGNATLGESGKAKPATLLTYLEPGTTFRLEPGARVVLTYLAKASEITVTGPAEGTIRGDTIALSRGDAPTVRSLDAGKAETARKFDGVQRDRLALATVQMRAGARPQIVIQGPRDIDVLGDTPTLAWQSIAGVKSYRVTLRDHTGRSLFERDVTASTVAIPPLARGEAFQWSVEGRLPSGQVLTSAAEFRVVDASRAMPLERLRPAAGAPFSERVLFAARLEAEGLGHDAKREWIALSAERPEDPTLREWAER